MPEREAQARRSRRDAPTGTYRVQLTPEHGFAALAALAPHLGRLGVSHAYLSPVLQAAPGSQHGYDVVDHRRIDDELGGEDGLRAAASALAEQGIGLVVDVVPNHTAMTTPEHLNQVLWQTLKEGPHSPYARWLDVEWEREHPLLMPVLGRRIDECLDDGEIRLDPHGGPDGSAVLRYHDHVVPVRAGTVDLPMLDLLAAQHYRLAYWKVADEELNYRRFFDVDTLVAIRVEDAEVFASTHALIVSLVRDGTVAGLRIDHPDGLADPAAYLDRLAAVTDGAWVVVEKILVGEEELPPEWACDGTTGYDAAVRIGAVFVDPAGAPVLRAAFLEHTGSDDGWPQVREQARRDVLSTLLVAEVDRLARLAYEVCQAHVRLRDYTLRGLTEAVLEVLALVPVYRAYVRPGVAPSPEAAAVLAASATEAVARRPDREAEIVLVRDLALGSLGRGRRRDEFVVRFQQTCGPSVAKGVEDTAGYRWFPLVSLSEVGGEPDRFGLAADDLHTWAVRRQARWPHALTAASTHDTKRSADVRARLAVLSEIPGEWVTTVRAWQDLVGGAIDGVSPTDTWLLWQTLVGAWPIDVERATAYAVKAAREAKLRTSWTEPQEEYEQRIGALVQRVFADADLVGSLTQVVERLHPGFAANVLGQTALQLFLPGVPDVYRGNEVLDLSLVDPDNRRPLDLARIEAATERARSGAVDPVADLDAAKARLTALGLHLRRDGRFAGTTYRGLAAEGEAADHLVGFVRGDEVVVAVTRLAVRLAAGGGWRGTTLRVPDGGWVDRLSGRRHDGGPLPLDDLLGAWPVAVLQRSD